MSIDEILDSILDKMIESDLSAKDFKIVDDIISDIKMQILTTNTEETT